MNAITTVPFHKNNLLLIEHKGEPYTPMRPIVEGMGLNWSYQYRKLQNHTKRWGVAVIATPSKGGEQSMLSLPLKKLFGWMMTIQPSRVKPELRETIEMYQDECDNALWAYWSEGLAVNHRATISPAQQRTIQETVSELAKENKAYAKYYGALKTHFRIGTYKDLPVNKLEEAIDVLQGVVVMDEKKSITHSVTKAYEMPPEQRSELDERMNRMMGLFHPFSEQFGDVLGIGRIIQGMNPRTGLKENNYLSIYNKGAKA